MFADCRIIGFYGATSSVIRAGVSDWRWIVPSKNIAIIGAMAGAHFGFAVRAPDVMGAGPFLLDRPLYGCSGP